MPIDPFRLDRLKQGNESPSDTTTARLGKIGLTRGGMKGIFDDNWHTQAVKEMLEYRSIENLTGDTREAFEDAFNITNEIYGDIYLIAPTADEWLDIGIDFIDLAAKYEDMQAKGLEPEILITAHLDPSQADALFAEKAKERYSPLGPGGLDVDISRATWRQLDVPHTLQPTIVKNSTAWTISLTEGRVDIPNVGISHVTLSDPTRPEYRELNTISQYLRLQLARIESRISLLDKEDTLPSCWLKGSYPGPHSYEAPGGYWDPLSKVVVITSYEGDTEVAVGSRSAVW